MALLVIVGVVVVVIVVVGDSSGVLASVLDGQYKQAIIDMSGSSSQ